MDISRFATPLHAAIFNHNLRSLEILMAHGANVNVKNNSGNTPLYSEFFGRPRRDIVLLFLNHGIDYNSKNNYGKSVKDLALETGDQSIIELFEIPTITKRAK